MLRTYSDLRLIEGLEERYRYLRLRGQVGAPTFGSERYANQNFYSSREWKNVRHHVIARDASCDLGVEGFEIHDRPYIHHINPMTIDDIADSNEWMLFDPDNLITVSHRTHNAIHYGDESQLPRSFVPRMPGDTVPWRKVSR